MKSENRVASSLLLSFCLKASRRESSPQTVAFAEPVVEMLFIFCLAALLWNGGCGSVSLRSVPVGQSLTLHCSGKNLYATLRWIRLSIDKGVECLATSDGRDSSDAVKIEKNESGEFDLPLHEVQLDDTGFYFCCEVWYTDLKIRNVTYLHVEEVPPEVTAIEEDPSEVHPGRSSKLQCSVSSSSKTSSCSERVYWFKPRAEKSPSLLVAHEHRGEECERNSTTGLKKCVYSVSRDVNSSRDETFYCAVVSCGQIFFGDGTKVPNEDPHHLFLTAVVVSSGLIISLGVNALLIYIVRKQKRDFCEPLFPLTITDLQRSMRFMRRSAVRKEIIVNEILSVNDSLNSEDQLVTRLCWYPAASSFQPALSEEHQQVNEEPLVYTMVSYTKRKSGREGRCTEMEENVTYSGVHVME